MTILAEISSEGHFDRGFCMTGRINLGDHPVYQLERRKPGGHVHHVHNIETDSGQGPYPPTLVPLYMVTQHLIYCFVSAFTGTVCLRVVG